MLQEQNSCSFNSQKENMMQATHVKQTVNSKQAYLPTTSQQTEQAKSQVSKQESKLELVRPQANSSRMFEAYNDCV
jgi:hypothetical protein